MEIPKSKIIFIFALLGCTSTRIPSPAPPTPTVRVYTPAEATKLIDSLLSLVVYMKPEDWQKNKDGTMSPSTTQKINKILTKDTLKIEILPQDTTRNPHDGNDTLIHAPN